ncbi:MAG: class I SAM-dependent methyltransferase [Planctomycetales bacterium]|nr:class I SAM-dependent methyltransferase [Planctomycetales bacterium]
MNLAPVAHSDASTFHRRLLVAMTCLFLFRAEHAVAQPDVVRSPPQEFMGRTIAPAMHFSGANWLTRASREAEEQPQLLLEELRIAPGQKLCDFGCGNGYYTLMLARTTGARGGVWAVDIQPEMLQLLRERAEPRGLDNIHYVHAAPEDPHLPQQSLDLVLMVDVYHEIGSPAEVMEKVRDALKPTGVVAVVEFREEDPSVPIRPLHKMSKLQVDREFRAHRLKLVRQSDRLPWQHVLWYARDDSPMVEIPLETWPPRESEGP